MNDLWLISPIVWATTDDADALRRQLRERDERIEELEISLMYANGRGMILLDAKNFWADRAHTAERAAAARLRAVKRMRLVARHYQLLALRLAVGAELSGVAEAAQRAAANAEAGRGE